MIPQSQRMAEAAHQQRFLRRGLHLLHPAAHRGETDEITAESLRLCGLMM